MEKAHDPAALTTPAAQSPIPAEQAPTATLLIGIGGTGANVLDTVKEALQKRSDPARKLIF